MAYISRERSKPWVYAVLLRRKRSQANPQGCCRRSSYFRKGRKDRVRESLFEASIRVKIDHNSTPPCRVALFGDPYSLRTDNGPQFARLEDFETFLRSQGVEQRRKTPTWTQANGEVERQNRALCSKDMVLVPSQELGIAHTKRTGFDLTQRDTLLK